MRSRRCSRRETRGLPRRPAAPKHLAGRPSGSLFGFSDTSAAVIVLPDGVLICNHGEPRLAMHVKLDEIRARPRRTTRRPTGRADEDSLRYRDLGPRAGRRVIAATRSRRRSGGERTAATGWPRVAGPGWSISSTASARVAGRCAASASRAERVRGIARGGYSVGRADREHVVERVRLSIEVSLRRRPDRPCSANTADGPLPSVPASEVRGRAPGRRPRSPDQFGAAAGRQVRCPGVRLRPIRSRRDIRLAPASRRCSPSATWSRRASTRMLSSSTTISGPVLRRKSPISIAGRAVHHRASVWRPAQVRFVDVTACRVDAPASAAAVPRGEGGRCLTVRFCSPPPAMLETRLISTTSEDRRRWISTDRRQGLACTQLDGLRELRDRCSAGRGSPSRVGSAARRRRQGPCAGSGCSPFPRRADGARIGLQPRLSSRYLAAGPVGARRLLRAEGGERRWRTQRALLADQVARRWRRCGPRPGLACGRPPRPARRRPCSAPAAHRVMRLPRLHDRTGALEECPVTWSTSTWSAGDPARPAGAFFGAADAVLPAAAVGGGSRRWTIIAAAADRRRRGGQHAIHGSPGQRHSMARACNRPPHIGLGASISKSRQHRERRRDHHHLAPGHREPCESASRNAPNGTARGAVRRRRPKKRPAGLAEVALPRTNSTSTVEDDRHRSPDLGERVSVEAARASSRGAGGEGGWFRGGGGVVARRGSRRCRGG